MISLLIGCPMRRFFVLITFVLQYWRFEKLQVYNFSQWLFWKDEHVEVLQNIKKIEKLKFIIIGSGWPWPWPGQAESHWHEMMKGKLACLTPLGRWNNLADYCSKWQMWAQRMPNSTRVKRGHVHQYKLSWWAPLSELRIRKFQGGKLHS